jgi:D-alanyl-lipoteichoic acid acyltransferase DltB (MBOAT superfamily)
MLFNSALFIGCFWPVVVAGFFVLGKRSSHLAALWLCAASLIFYGCWNIRYVPLLLGSVLFNYGAGYLIGHARLRNLRRGFAVLTAAVSLNLLLLSYYKYANFFLGILNSGIGVDWTFGRIVLPLGISFFTFTQIAFLVDAYRGKAREYNFVHYLLFVTYFPHLIAGPILHHAQMMPQFARRSTYRPRIQNFATGITFFILGLTKKVLLADGFAPTATAIFTGAEHHISPTLIEAWLGALFYTLELYFDFSGYCDMAIGISFCFNIRLPINFDSPYKSASIIDFWRRWHMTLSAFLRDYLYFALGGNRLGAARRYANLLVTMLLGGLWHGAGWTFVVWGGLHGLYLCINHAFRAFREQTGWREGRFGAFGSACSVLATFISVVIAWVFFRADSFSTAVLMLRGMAGLNGISLAPGFWPSQIQKWLAERGVLFQGTMPISTAVVMPLLKLALGFFIIWGLPNSQQWILRFKARPRRRTSRTWLPELLLQLNMRSVSTSLVLGTLFAFCLLWLLSGRPSEFLYYQF